MNKLFNKCKSFFLFANDMQTVSSCIYLLFRITQQMGHVSKLLPVLYWQVFYRSSDFEDMFFVQPAICVQRFLT